MSANSSSSNHPNIDDAGGGAADATRAASTTTLESTTNDTPQPRAKINISLGGKKKKKSTANKSSNSSNLLKDGKSSLLAEEYSTIAEEAEIISQKRKEEGTILVIPCAQGANEEEKRKHPLLASRLALLQKGTDDNTAYDKNNDGNAKDINDSPDATKLNGGDEQTRDAANKDLEDEVVKQLIQSANETQNDREYDGNNTTPNGRGLVIAAPTKNNLITQQTTVINEDEQFHQELAHHASDVDPTSSVYANVAIGDFGSALLRGMGWKGGDNNNKGGNKKEEETIKARPHRLGLGAAPLPLPTTKTSGSSKGGIHRRARRPEEVKRDEERQKQQEEAERRAAEKKRLDVQVTLQPGSVVHVRDDNNGASKRAKVVKTAGVPGLNRILVQMEGSTEDISVAKNSVKLCSWDELERMPFQVTRASKSADRERTSKSSETEPHQNGSSSRRKRSRSYGSEEDRRSRKDTSRHSKRSDKERYNDRHHGRDSSDDDESRDRKRRSKKHKRKKRHHRDRSYSRSRSRSRSRSPDHKKRHKHESHHKSSSHKSQSSDSQNHQHLNWLIPNIRVRLISKKIPAYYLQKGVVQDVTRTSQSSPKAVLLMDNGQVIDKVPERYLETALPKTGGKVIVLEGKHHWKKGRLLERSRDGVGVIQFTEDLEVVNISLDSIAEWCLNDDE